MVAEARGLAAFPLARPLSERQNPRMANATLTIDLDALTANWQALNEISGETVETGAVVKADGYGLGAGRVARALMQAGARRFFVATADEGAALRGAIGPGPEINIFSGHMAGDTDMIHDMQLVPMLNSVAQLTRHLEALPGHPFGIQLDTGMNRLGMEPGEWFAVRDLAMTAGPRLLISHLACADEPDHPMNEQQLASFREMSDGLGVPRSLAATGGTLLGPEYHFDLIRPGIGLYGGLPFADANPVTHLSLPVVQVREVDPGEVVGYGSIWTAERATKVATVSVGYADGIFRHLAGKLHLYSDDIACPVIGRISMDLITVDVTDLAEPPRSLDLLCPSQGIDDLADLACTIGYEVLTSLGNRFTRRYAGGGR